ncbi:unnamed protein product [Adineta ricciae]|uniref:Uncharacterized protein n=1 Tax=Adineta ricciae TaxID=249248 RepID=A0A815UR23_ADIRI|nr:unnamed protein product [Adineta ricciae]
MFFSQFQADEDGSSIAENIQPESVDRIDEENSSITDMSNDVLCLGEYSENHSDVNKSVVPDGVTESSITIVRSQDKATCTSPLHTSNAVDFSTSSISSRNRNRLISRDFQNELTFCLLECCSKSTQTDDVIPKPSLKKDQLKAKKKKIARRLNLSIKQLRECKENNDIRKTCRSITKCLYPDVHIRASMTILKMSNQLKKDIRDYAKILHPDQSDAQKHFLHNAIGNVFASAKNKKKKT